MRQWSIAAAARPQAAAGVLGLSRVAWLGYADSGMTGWEQNHHPGSFHLADLEEAAGRLAQILDEESADVVVGYDWHGGYGHPDHVKVHHVRAPRRRARGQPAPGARVDDEPRPGAPHVRGGEGRGHGRRRAGTRTQPMDDGNPLGSPRTRSTCRSTSAPTCTSGARRCEAHASQATDIGVFLGMPHDVFEVFFGAEHYIERGREPGMRRGWFFED